MTNQLLLYQSGVDDKMWYRMAWCCVRYSIARYGMVLDKTVLYNAARQRVNRWKGGI